MNLSLATLQPDCLAGLPKQLNRMIWRIRERVLGQECLLTRHSWTLQEELQNVLSLTGHICKKRIINQDFAIFLKGKESIYILLYFKRWHEKDYRSEPSMWLLSDSKRTFTILNIISDWISLNHCTPEFAQQLHFMQFLPVILYAIVMANCKKIENQSHIHRSTLLMLSISSNFTLTSL